MPNPTKYSDEELIEFLQDFADELGETPTLQQIDEADEMPYGHAYLDRFGTYSEACLEAGITPNQKGNPSSPESIIETVADWVAEHEELPSQDDFSNDPDLPSASTIHRRFGGLRNVFAKAILKSNPGRVEVEVAEYSGSNTVEVAPGDEAVFRGDSMAVTVRRPNGGDDNTN